MVEFRWEVEVDEVGVVVYYRSEEAMLSSIGGICS
jgi:hypothetical protein